LVEERTQYLVGGYHPGGGFGGCGVEVGVEVGCGW
jgi:hypothetical protein